MYRRITTISVAATAALLVPLSGAYADGPGPQNQVGVRPTADGASQAAARLQVVPYSGATDNSENLALAEPHDCTNCKGVAIAMQAVIVIGQPQSSSPQNYAIAVNNNCNDCVAAAWARQVIVDTGSNDEVHLTDAAQSDLDAAHRDLRDLAAQARQAFAGIDQSSDPSASAAEIQSIKSQVDQIWSRVMNDVCSPQDYREQAKVQNLSCGVTPPSSG